LRIEDSHGNRQQATGNRQQATGLLRAVARDLVGKVNKCEVLCGVNMVRDFKELDIWNKSFELVGEVYGVVSDFPREEIYGLSQQLKRAAVSVSSNITEGCGRRTSKDFVGFLYMAFGSVREVECQLMIAKKLGYINDMELKRLMVELNKLAGMLMKFIRHVSTLGNI